MMALLFFALSLFSSFAHGQLTDVQKQELILKNYLRNPGFENGKADWTASGGSFSAVNSSSGSQFSGIGKLSGTWDSSASAQTLTSTAVAIPRALYAQNGVAYCRFATPSDTSTYKLQVYDGTNVVAETNIASTAGFALSSVNFVFPSSGNISLRIVSVSAAEPLIAFDDCAWGLATNVTDVSQATFVGSIRYTGATSCLWSTSSTSFANFSADTDCGTPTVAGAASAPATKIPGISFASGLPPGEYLFIANSYFLKSTGTDSSVHFRFSDGTNATSAGSMYVGTSLGSSMELLGRLSYTTAQTGPLTIQIQGAVLNGAASAQISVGDTTRSELEILVYRFPTASEQGFRANQLPVNWQGAFTGLASGWQTTSASYADLSAGVSMSLGVVGTPRNLTGVTQAATSLPGVTFTPPSTGNFKVCATGAYYGATVGNLYSVRMTDGTTEFESVQIQAPASNYGFPFKVCGVKTVASIAATTMKLQGKSSGGNLTISTGVPLTWTIESLDQGTNAPVLVGSVTSNSTGPERVERAVIAITGASACSITSQSGTWLTGCTASSSAATVTHSGVFSAQPTCTVTTDSSTGGLISAKLQNGGSASQTVFQCVNTSFAATTCNAHLICMGPR